MRWTNQPLGMTRHDDLLAILDSLRFTLHRANRGGNPEYVAGFDDALAAVARSVNLTEYFTPSGGTPGDQPAPVINVELPQLDEGVTR